MSPDESLVIATRDLSQWLAFLLKRIKLIAPVTGPGGDVIYSGITSPDEVVWQFHNSLQPPKQFLLPQTDPLLDVRRDNGRYRVESTRRTGPQALLNIRSCDVSGLLFLLKMHAREPADTEYVRRADDTVLVSLACNEPCPLGFCICCDAGPFLREGFDLQLVDLGDRMLVEIGSSKGRALIDDSSRLFRAAEPSEIEQRRVLEATARTKFGDQTCHFGSAMRRISTRRVAEELWDQMGDWCLECGGCTLVCPTCYCFSVKDRCVDDGWTRCRMWDSCQYTAFTLEASGHNPRQHRKDRMKRRFFHKVSAQYYQRDGAVGCVGCGRCIKVCMGTTDMPAVVAAIRKGEWHG